MLSRHTMWGCGVPCMGFCQGKGALTLQACAALSGDDTSQVLLVRSQPVICINLTSSRICSSGTALMNRFGDAKPDWLCDSTVNCLQYKKCR